MRDTFFAYHAIAVSFASLVVLVLVYYVFPTTEWLVAFDPLLIRFNLPGAYVQLESSDLPYGFAIEWLRTILIAITVWALLGYFLNPDQINENETILSKALNVARRGSGMPTLPSPPTVRGIAEFLWTKRWAWVVGVAVFVLAFYHFYVGPKALLHRFQGQQDIEAHAFGSPTQKLIPCQVLGTLAANCAGVATEIEPPTGEALWGAATKKNFWQNAFAGNEARRGVYPYWIYFFYSLGNYLFLVLPIVISFSILLSSVRRNITAFAAELTKRVREAKPKEILRLHREAGQHLRRLVLDVLRPTGWLVVFLMINAVFEHWFGYFTLLNTAVFFTILSYMLLLVVLINVLSAFDSIDKYAVLLGEAVAKSADADKDELSNAAATMMPEAIFRDKSSMWVWRVFAYLFAKLRQITPGKTLLGKPA